MKAKGVVIALLLLLEYVRYKKHVAEGKAEQREEGLNHKELCAHPMQSLDFILQSQGASETRLPPLSIYCGPYAVFNHCDALSLVRDNQSKCHHGVDFPLSSL